MLAYIVKWKVRKNKQIGFLYLLDAMDLYAELKADKRCKNVTLEFNTFEGNIT